MVREEATTDHWVVLGGFAVAVEEVKHVGFCWWCGNLRRHFSGPQVNDDICCAQKKSKILVQLFCVPVGIGGEKSYFWAGALLNQLVLAGGGN